MPIQTVRGALWLGESQEAPSCYLLLALGGDVFGGGGASVTVSYVESGFATCPLVFEAAVKKFR